MLVQHIYKCMIVKRIEGNRLITCQELGEMYVSSKYDEETKKFLRSAKNLREAVERAEEYNKKILESASCVVAEAEKAGKSRLLVKKKNGKLYDRRKAFKPGTWTWRVYIEPNGNKYSVSKAGNKHLIGELFKY